MGYEMARGRSRAPKTPAHFEDAPDVREIAEDLIAEYHPHLEDRTLDYVFRTPAAKGKGAKRRHEGGRFFVVEVAKHVWARWSEGQKRARIDSALCRLAPGKDGLTLVDPDLQEFTVVAKRHGLADEEVRAFGEALQPHLPHLNGKGNGKAAAAATGAEAAVPAGDR